MQQLKEIDSNGWKYFCFLEDECVRPSGGCVYFISLTKASANNNGESELRPPEPTGCASRNGLYNRPKPRLKANYSFVLGQPRGMI